MNQKHDAPEGGAEWKMVPVEPTPEMFEAGDIHELMLPTMAYDRLRAIWDGMIEAAPTRTTKTLCPSCGLDDDLKAAGACGRPDDEICPEPITPTPPAPPGLVDAVQAYLAAEDAYGDWSKDPDQAGCSAEHYNATWDELEANVTKARRVLDSTLSGQQGGER